jgi:uncharacterized protein (TIGR03435 family)
MSLTMNPTLRAARRGIAALFSAAAIGLVTVSVAAAAVWTQASAAARDTFDVVSIRPVPGSQAATPCFGGFELTPGRITITGATVYRMVSLAYGMPCAAANLDLITGGPDWLKKDTFNIQATLPQGVPSYTFQQLQNNAAPALQTLLRSLLADRFQLAVHRAPKDTPIYNVYFVKAGKVTLSADQSHPSEAANPMASPLNVRRDAAAGTMLVSAKAIPMAALLNGGQGREGRFIVDKTGLTGLYDVEPSVIDVGLLPAGVSTWPEMMTYLGFRLESTRGPIDAIVIDRLERPTGN